MHTRKDTQSPAKSASDDDSKRRRRTEEHRRVVDEKRRRRKKDKKKYDSSVALVPRKRSRSDETFSEPSTHPSLFLHLQHPNLLSDLMSKGYENSSLGNLAAMRPSSPDEDEEWSSSAEEKAIVPVDPTDHVVVKKRRENKYLILLSIFLHINTVVVMCFCYHQLDVAIFRFRTHCSISCRLYLVIGPCMQPLQSTTSCCGICLLICSQ